MCQTLFVPKVEFQTLKTLCQTILCQKQRLRHVFPAFNVLHCLGCGTRSQALLELGKKSVGVAKTTVTKVFVPGMKGATCELGRGLLHASLVPTPATRSILTVLKDGERVYEVGELPKTL